MVALMASRRKLPPDNVLRSLVLFGFRTGDIAERFDVTPQRVSEKKRALGLPLMPLKGPDRMRRNGARPASRYFG